MSSDTARDIPTAMSTSALEAKLKELREKSNKHSQILTAKLASSQSGQNLLHIGTSLSTLPPDLHSLLTQLHPVLSSAEATEKQFLQRLQRLVQCGNEIRLEERRVQTARDCAELYQDLLAAEAVVKRDASSRRWHVQPATPFSSPTRYTNEQRGTDDDEGPWDQQQTLGTSYGQSSPVLPRYHEVATSNTTFLPLVSLCFLILPFYPS
jgi:hypothetical protein